MRGFLAIVGRDLRLTLGGGADAWTALMFFMVVITLFPLGVGPGPTLLARLAPGVIWVAALLAVLLTIDRLFARDFEDGTLDRLVLLPLPVEALVLAKVLAHWLVTGLPLILVAPVMALMLGLPAAGYPALFLGLAVGTPALSLIGAIGGALTLGARRGGALIALLVLPLFVPVLVFAVAAIDAAVGGLDPAPHLYLLGGVSVLALTLAPLATAAALRQAVG